MTFIHLKKCIKKSQRYMYFGTDENNILKVKIELKKLLNLFILL